MKEKVASITTQREQKTETSANAISTFICHASEELETSLAQELRLPASSRWAGELLGGTGEGSFPLKARAGVCRHAGGVHIIQKAHRRAVGMSPDPQPCSSSQPLHQANVLRSLHSSPRQPCGMSHRRPEPRPLLSWRCGGSATLTGAEMKRGGQRKAAALAPRRCLSSAQPSPAAVQPFPRSSFFFFFS